MSTFLFVLTIVLWPISILNLLTRKSNEIFSDSDITQINKRLIRVIFFGVLAVLFAYLNKYVWENIFVASAGVAVLIGFIAIGSLITMLVQWAIAPSVSSVQMERLANENAIKSAKEYAFYKTKYDEIMMEAKVPDNAQIIKVKNKNEQLNIKRGEYYIWVKDNSLLLFRLFESGNYPDEYEKFFSLKVMPIKDIEYYSTRGEIYRENRISGGGGGGSSLKGAVIGGAIAGDVGAVIGSRKKTEEIKSELITHDTRETFINFYDTSGIKRSIFFDFSEYQKLKEIIPQKDFPIVEALRQKDIILKSSTANSTIKVTEQIRDLSQLRDDGIITTEEFEMKKKELLSQI